MAHQQAYVANKGTLVPGQTISVNKHTVQVERYLSQGGFAHVYLVRTPTPVYNTTYHVLKRIAVPNELMLSEVKKEVDVMRILKGHPNIVHLIDAAWHRMPNGTFEVFILMEFCPGGGIIDMMNRRLRERLTEAEILQIFVDVCEGVAAMHNLRPPLLHRDLKVENILQSSATSYKLCDFGSATPVAPRPPSNAQEIRALEADLNRHTTLQYRAPEMVDPYLRRPVDEKSDVWALGVLLYKLCYYTTPFEEHGPLAILNVQYKIPSYPIYSAQMNNLIASMLREHGSQRPSVFEILIAVHRMRGTKSRFVYNLPPRQPLSPRHAEVYPQTNALDDLISYRSSSSPTLASEVQPSIFPTKNAGVQARERVLEAIAPMRRGRPAPIQSTSPPASPAKEQEKENRKWADAELDMDFGVEEEARWKAVKNTRGAVRGHRSGLASPEAWKVKSPALDDAWDLGKDRDKGRDRDRRKTYQAGLSGFGDSFDAMLGSSTSAAAAAASLVPEKSGLKPVSIPDQLPASNYNRLGLPKSKDAFDGLGLSPLGKPPPPTLGEARKARIEYTSNLTIPSPSSRPSSALSPAPAPSPSPRPPSHVPSPRLPSHAPSPAPSPWQAHKLASEPSSNLSAEERFPSLEDLDRTLLPGAALASNIPSQPPCQLPSVQKLSRLPTSSTVARVQQSPRSNFSGGLKPPGAISNTLNIALGGSGSAGKYSYDGVRSEHVTGAAMRASREARKAGPDKGRENPSRPSRTSPVRPQVVRTHHSSVPVKHSSIDEITPAPAPSPALAPDTSPSAAQILGRSRPRDWLTGSDDELPKPPGTPVLRDSPRKRASVIERDPVVQSPQEAVADKYPSPKRQPSPPSPSPPSPSPPSPNPPTLQKSGMDRVTMGTDDDRLQLNSKRKPVDTLIATSPAEESVFKSEALTENWSPVAPSMRHPLRKDTSSSSGGDEEPEDANGFVPSGQARKVFEFKEKVGENKRRGKGRQSSVHDLVDLWGGGLGAEKKDKVEEKVTGAVNGLSTGSGMKEREEVKKPTALPPSVGKPRSASPSPMLSPSAETPTKSYSSDRTSPSRRKQSTSALEHSNPPTPVSPAPTSRSRHQSMFLSPGVATKAFPHTQVDKSTAVSTLALPPDPRARRTARRTSISDMVQKYEAMGGKPIAPAPSAKPPHMKVATHGTASSILSGSGSAPVPSHARARSNFGPGPSLGDPDDESHDRAKPRTSPTNLPRTSPVGLLGLASDKKAQDMLSGRRSPFKPAETGGQTMVVMKGSLDIPAKSISSPLRTSSPLPPVATGEEPPRSASPEKPYQGVGRLIDQWQKKSGEVDAPRRGGFAPRKAGVVAGRGR
ncbi:hypothetical protein EW146_g868 [Bondarzewia mesenterica]|uniref:non-specific serine/threonine protein kinase n=1 Tax=Bondarzewia mesenterica TaxID=1095465 RepID=A0A4V3XG86_9AGAM|nr:hypothetical protein EW146_g868 [Bondarzewia mesenterica]